MWLRIRPLQVRLLVAHVDVTPIVVWRNTIGREKKMDADDVEYRDDAPSITDMYGRMCEDAPCCGCCGRGLM
jgi:hypothetical protein